MSEGLASQRRNSNADDSLDEVSSLVKHKDLQFAFDAWHSRNWQDIFTHQLNNDNDSDVLGIYYLVKGTSAFALGFCEEARKYFNLSIKYQIDNSYVAQMMMCILYYQFAVVSLVGYRENRAKEYFKKAVDLSAIDDISLPAFDISLVEEMLKNGLLPEAAAEISSEFKNLSSETFEVDKLDARLKVIETEVGLLNHEISLAIRKNQMYQIAGDIEKSTVSIESNDVEKLKSLSPSQLGQDLWVLQETNFKREGFFVEFGATDGILLSNTYLLEKQFDWKGICAEPNPEFYEQLTQNRDCILSNSCIAQSTGEIVDFVLGSEYGGIDEFSSKGRHQEKVKAYKAMNKVLKLETISLHDFLLAHNAPKTIDYVSIDTEGSEFSIISNFPFEEWDIRMLTIEHNFEDQREDIYSLLASKGYRRIEVEWDDWFIKEE